MLAFVLRRLAQAVFVMLTVGLIAFALAHLPAAFSSVGLLSQPVMAAAFAWVLLGEPVVALQVAGGAVVLVGIYLARRGSKGSE